MKNLKGTAMSKVFYFYMVKEYFYEIIIHYRSWTSKYSSFVSLFVGLSLIWNIKLDFKEYEICMTWLDLSGQAFPRTVRKSSRAFRSKFPT